MEQIEWIDGDEVVVEPSKLGLSQKESFRCLVVGIATTGAAVIGRNLILEFIERPTEFTEQYDFSCFCCPEIFCKKV